MQRVEHAEGGAPVAQAVPRQADLAEHPRAVVGVDAGVEGRGVLLHLVGAAADQRLDLAADVGEDHAAVGLHAALEEHAGHALGELAQAVQRFGALELGAKQVGDVDVRAEHPLGRAVGAVGAQRAAVLHVDPVAGAVAQAEPVLVPGRLAAQVAARRCVRAGEVVGVGEAPPGLDRQRCELVQAIAEHLRPAGVVDGLAGLHVPFPGTGAGAGEDGLQALAFVGERRVGATDAVDHQGAKEQGVRADLVDVAGEVVGVGDLRVHREEELAQRHQPRRTEQRGGVEGAGRAHAAQQHRGRRGEQRHQADLDTDLQAGQPLARDEGARRPVGPRQEERVRQTDVGTHREQQQAGGETGAHPPRQQHRQQQAERGEQARGDPEVDRLLRVARGEEVRHAEIGQHVGETQHRHAEEAAPQQPGVGRRAALGRQPGDREHQHRGDDRRRLQRHVQRQVVRQPGGPGHGQPPQREHAGEADAEHAEAAPRGADVGGVEIRHPGRHLSPPSSPRSGPACRTDSPGTARSRASAAARAGRRSRRPRPPPPGRASG